MGQICIIIWPVPRGRGPPPALFDAPLVYVQRFDIIPQINKQLTGSSTLRGPYPDAATSLYIMKRAERSDGSLMGDFIRLDQIRAVVDLVPRFGTNADTRLTSTSSRYYYNEFFLNKYFTKELYWAFDSVGTLVPDS